MGTFAGSVIATRVRKSLNDEGVGAVYSDAELLDVINEAIEQISADRQDVYVTNTDITLTAGCEQTLGGNVIVLQKIPRNRGQVGNHLSAAVPAAGGTGYKVGDTIVLAGGTFTTAAVVQVTTIGTNGVVTGLSIVTPGSYSANPANPIAQASTSGAGTGPTVTGTLVANVLADGPVIRQVDEDTMNRVAPTWQSDPQSATVIHFVYNKDDPKRFYVWPPAAIGTTVRLTASEVAPALSALTNIISLDDTWVTAIYYFVMARQHMRNSDDGNMEKAGQYDTLYWKQLGAEEEAREKVLAQEFPK